MTTSTDIHVVVYSQGEELSTECIPVSLLETYIRYMERHGKEVRVSN